MCGGLRRRGTDFTVQIMREQALQAKRDKETCSQIFLDAKDAFYSIQRSAATGVPESGEVLASVCARLQLPVDALHRMHGNMSGTGLHYHIAKQFAMRFGESLFLVDGAPGVAATGTGTRPGLAHANLLSNFAFSGCRAGAGGRHGRRTARRLAASRRRRRHF